jgi:hypothetical protein
MMTPLLMFKISYSAFSRAVRTRHRFVRDADTESFLASVLGTAAKRSQSIESGSFFWRAQVGFEEEDDGQGKDIRPLRPKRMVPLRDAAREGRINPKGIPCLYLATDRNTAIAEVRPWRHARVSVGRFETTATLKVVDCSADNNVKRLIHPRSKRRVEEDVWGDINEAFSRPIEPNDTSPDYVPTQVLAELFRHNGYDGVVFKSSVAAGHNVALYDLGAAKLTMRELHRVKAIEYRANRVWPNRST